MKKLNTQEDWVKRAREILPGGGFGRSQNSYTSMNLADFGYWHASLEDADVTALYNQGSIVGRPLPTTDFTITT